MNLSDELSKLAELKEKGILSSEEFEQAKKKILSENTPRESRHTQPPKNYHFEDKTDDSVGKAANRYVSFQIIMAVIGIIIFLFFFAPMMCRSGAPGFSPGFP